MRVNILGAVSLGDRVNMIGRVSDSSGRVTHSSRVTRRPIGVELLAGGHRSDGDVNGVGAIPTFTRSYRDVVGGVCAIGKRASIERTWRQHAGLSTRHKPIGAVRVGGVP